LFTSELTTIKQGAAMRCSYLMNLV